MYAIVNIAGKQFKVTQNQRLYAPHLDVMAGSEITFDRVLLIGDGDEVSVGAPTVAGAKITGRILNQVRGGKVIVFKKKRRKGYKKTQGHRQDYTEVLIERIVT